MHRCIKQLVSILLCSVLYTPALWANGDYALHNESFSSFEVGQQSISYGEELNYTIGSRGGLLASNKPSVANLSHRMEGYSASGARTGLYITSIATLLNDQTTEDWNLEDFGHLQSNELYFSWNELNINWSYIFKPGHQWLYGARHIKLLYTRYAFTLGPAAQDFENALNDYYQPSSPIEYEAPQGSVTENFTDFIAQAGYRYDSFFDGSSTRLRKRFTALVGIPVYTTVTNTDIPDSEFSTTFNGYYATVGGSVAWTAFKSTQIMFSVQADYRSQKQFEEKNPTGGVIQIIPNNSALSIFTSLGVVWFF